MIALLSEYFLTKNAKDWVEAIHAVKVPVGVINSIEDAFNEPQVQHREMVVNIPHALNPEFKVIASPIKISETPVEYDRAPPRLGEHTQMILSRFKTQDELNRLKALGVIDGDVS